MTRRESRGPGRRPGRLGATIEAPRPADGQARVYIKPSSPFTSGNLHMGHVRDYSIGDAYARFRRARGDAVLLGFGFDAFGLPAELAAIERQEPPADWVAQCGERMLGQMKRLGFSFDYDRVFYSSDESQYRWSQWLFLTLLEAGLIYREDATVDWCDTCQTTLASIQVEDGRCWRCHNEVRLIRRPTWFLRITPYLEENDRNTEKLENWDDLALATQRYILGRSDGVEVDLAGRRRSPDRLQPPSRRRWPGQLRAALAAPPGDRRLDRRRRGAGGARADALGRLGSQRPRRPLRARLRHRLLGRRSRAASRCRSWSRRWSTPASARPRPSAFPPSTRPTATSPRGSSVSRPSSRRRTRKREGMALSRPPPRSRAPARPSATAPTTSRSRASAPGARRSRSSTARPAAPVPVPEADLPVVLPRDIKPTGEGNPLAERPDFVDVACPSCGGAAKRETDTLDCHFDALWLWVPAAVPPADRAEQMFTHPDLKQWLPSERLVAGGDSGGFVFDQRIVTKALRDIGPFAFLADGEPFAGCLFHEMVIADGRKMSKHLGNVVNPDELVEQYGADTVRLAILYAAGPAKTLNWSDGALRFANRFLRGLWTYSQDRFAALEGTPHDEEAAADTEFMRDRLRKWCDNGLARITEDTEQLQMHKAVRNITRLFERIQDFEKRVVKRRGQLDRADAEAQIAALVLLARALAPFAPHAAEELLLGSGVSRQRSCRFGGPRRPRFRSRQSLRRQPGKDLQTKETSHEPESDRPW